METNFLAKVEQLSGVSSKELAAKTHRQVIDDVVLPIVLRPGGQDSRGWRIPDSYMSLIAEFGEYLYNKDKFTGSMLLEIALQRLSCGAVLHKPTSYDVLPAGYEKYSARHDQYGLMSNECWIFLTKQIKTCLRENSTREHAERIVLGLINHVANDGKTLNGYMLGGIDFKTSGKEVIEWATEIAFGSLPFHEVYNTLATPENWRRFSWLKENWKDINQKDFFDRVQVKGFFAKRKVKKEIFAMD